MQVPPLPPKPRRLSGTRTSENSSVLRDLVDAPVLNSNDVSESTTPDISPQHVVNSRDEAASPSEAYLRLSPLAQAVAPRMS